MSAPIGDPVEPLERQKAEELFRHLEEQVARSRRTRRIARVASVGCVALLTGGALAWAVVALSGLRSGPMPRGEGVAPSGVRRVVIAGPVELVDLGITYRPAPIGFRPDVSEEEIRSIAAESGTPPGAPGTLLLAVMRSDTRDVPVWVVSAPDCFAPTTACHETGAVFDATTGEAVLSYERDVPPYVPFPAPGEELPNYEFTDMSVGDYVDPVTGEVDPSKTLLRGTESWTSDVFPGDHGCTFTVLGRDGEIVGSVMGDFAAMNPSSRIVSTHDVPNGGVEAEITCSPERKDTPAAYTISDERVEPWALADGEIGYTIAYRVEWPPVPTYPSLNACVRELRDPAGAILRRSTFTLGTGEGIMRGDLKGTLPEGSTPDQIPEMTATVTCVPFTGHENWPN